MRRPQAVPTLWRLRRHASARGASGIIPRMKDLLEKMNARMATMAQGSNGPDTLGRVSMGIGLACGILNLFFYNIVLSMLSSMGIFYALYRLFSRNVPQRQRENERFLELLKQPGAARERRRKKAADRGALVRVECEECGQGLSVPKGKGTIRVVCPKCQHETIATT